MDSSSSSAESKATSLACAIAEFERDTGCTKRSQTNSGLQAFLDSLVPLLLLEPAVPKRCIRTAREPLPSYDLFWFTDADKFPATVSCFEKITVNSQIMDSSFQQSITSAVASAVATAVASIQAKHKSDILSLREMIKKSLLLRQSLSAIPSSDPDAIPKAFSGGDPLPKASTERWNQADLGYFDLHLNTAHREGEIMSVRKDVYYRIVVFFIQRF